MIPISINPLEFVKKYAVACGIALVLVVATCFGLYVWNLQRKAEQLSTANTTAVATGAADETWRRGHITYTRDREEANNATEQVLDRNPDWANQPLPNDVADRLRKHPDAAR